MYILLKLHELNNEVNNSSTEVTHLHPYLLIFSYHLYFACQEIMDWSLQGKSKEDLPESISLKELQNK